MIFPQRILSLMLAAILLPELFPISDSQHGLTLVNAHSIELNATSHHEHKLHDILYHYEPHANGEVECKMCSYVATELNTTLFHNPKVLGIITNDIEKICTFLPTSVQTECMNAAVNIAPIVLAQIGEFIADEGCEELGICPGRL
jgi:hypothetical protein